MELAEEITAFVDNEVEDFPIKYRLGQLVNYDFRIRNEYLIQKRIKELLQNRFACCCIPVETKIKILQELT